jgi:hypothetical protein
MIVVVPLPLWDLFDIHQWQSSPSVELAQSAKVISCRGSLKTTEGHARPPIAGNSVMAGIAPANVEIGGAALLALSR